MPLWLAGTHECPGSDCVVSFDAATADAAAKSAIQGLIRDRVAVDDRRRADPAVAREEGAGLGSGAVAPDESLDFDLAAAGLRAEGGDALRLVEVLAVKLEDALPGRAAVERRGVRLLSKQKRVERIDVELGDATYQLISDGRKVTGMRGQAVRGVTIKREELGLDAWVERLTRELDELAQSSTEARAALDRLLGA